MPNKPFHQSKAWKKLAKEHKLNRCKDCGKTEDIQSGHILAASRFPMFRLWEYNLKYQCGPCNLKQGTKTKWSIKAIYLWSLYVLVKIVRYSIIALCYFILFRYAYLDIEFNNSTITNHIKTDFIDAYNAIR